MGVDTESMRMEARFAGKGNPRYPAMLLAAADEIDALREQARIALMREKEIERRSFEEGCAKGSQEAESFMRSELEELANSVVKAHSWKEFYDCYAPKGATHYCTACGGLAWDGPEEFMSHHKKNCVLVLAQRIVEEINAASRAASTPSATEPD